MEHESTELYWSDCATHNEPAYPAGECDCGVTIEARTKGNNIMEIVEEVVSGRCDERQVTMGEFVPHALLYLGKGHESKIWAIGYLRSETFPPVHQSFARAAYLRESFALAWLVLSQSLSATLAQATIFFRIRFRNMAARLHHRAQPVSSIYTCETSNVEITGRGEANED